MIERVVVSDGRHAGEQVLQPADEQPLDQRVRARFADRAIVRETGTQIGNPLRRVLIPVPALEPPIMIELEVIVGVHQAGQHDAALQIDHRVVAPGPFTDRQNPRGEADRVGRTARGHDPRVHERHGVGPDHRSRTAWNTTITRGLRQRRRNAFTAESPSSLKRGSRIAST
jgi:hypothetical protein